MTMTRTTILAFVLVLCLTTSLNGQSYIELTRPEKVGTPLELGMAGYAKVLCSAVFVSQREIDEAAKVSGYFFVP